MRRSGSRRTWFELYFGALCWLLAACSSQTHEGVLRMTLTGTGTSGEEYRLRDAVFHITGPSSVDVSSEDDPAADSIRVELDAGDYAIALDPGWFLERSRGDGTFERVEATLVSSNPQPFTITAEKTTNVRYRFRVGGVVIELGGTLVIGIEIEDCGRRGMPALSMIHEGKTSTVHTIREDPSPAAGPQIFTLPPLTENLTITADGLTLPHELLADPDVTETQVRATVPDGTATLRLAYDIVDGSLPYEGRWYLRHPTDVSGPRQVCIALPDNAVIDRLDWPDTDPAPARVVFELPAGSSEPFVIYSTLDIPDLYDRIETPNFMVRIAQAHRRYHPAILGLLESLYALYGEYTGQDANRIQGQFRYPYSYPPTHWRWGDIEISGGLSVKGMSAVNALLVPMISLPPSNGFNPMVAITAHELGNGWWGTWEGPDPENHPPAWINNEGHSGFLRAEAELDLGYCEDARREHASHYSDFLRCTSECGGEILLISLQERFGWDPFRAYYAAIQADAFDLRGMSEVERASVVIRFFSEQVGLSLVPLFDAARISMTQAVRDELTARFAPADVPILSDLTCRPERLRVAPERVHAAVPDNATTAEAVAYACAPGGWSAALAPRAALSLTVSPTTSCGTATVQAILSQTGFGAVGTLEVSAPGVLDSPQRRTIRFTPLHDLLANGGFEQPLEPSWVQVAHLPDAAMFTLDAQAPHGGNRGLRLDATEANDVRLVQTVAVAPHTRYRLSGWIRTENVAGGPGASLTIEFPGTGWRLSLGTLGTNDWMYVVVEEDSGSQTSFQVQARLGHYGSLSTGRAWFDDLRLEMVP